MSLPPTHPKANEYELMGEADLQELADRIKAHGQINPITFSAGPIGKGLLIDGRNRWLACELANRVPDSQEIHFFSEDEIAEFIISENDIRRHDSEATQEKKREERRARVVAAKAASKSFRAIAKEEGISPMQVRRDLEASGGTPVPPEKTIGLDGKEYPSHREAQPTATQAEVAASVEATFLKAGPLDPKTLLPVAPKTVGVESSTPTKEPSWQHWNTPPWLVDLIRRVGPIGLDPCHNDGSYMQAGLTLSEKENGLEEGHIWHHQVNCLLGNKQPPLIAVNPPWQNMLPWVDRILRETTQGAQVILIGPAGNPSSEWWQKAARNCSLRCDLSKRVSYYKEGKEEASPRDSTVLFYWGNQPGRFAAVFGALGVISREVPEATYAAAKEALRKEALDERQQALPLEVAPQSEAKPTPPKEENVPAVRTKEEPTREERLLMGQPPTDRMGTCARCGALCHPMRPCVCIGEPKEEEPPPRLHASLKACAKGYQQEGYEVRISTPRQKGQAVSSKSVMGYLGGVADRDVIQHSAIRDEQEDAYEIIFSTNRGLLCTLHATRREPPITSPLKESAAPIAKEERSIWLGVAIEEIKACNYTKEVHEAGERLLTEAPTEKDRQDFAAFLIECKTAKPPAKPYNHKAPAPKGNKRKNEETKAKPVRKGAR